MKGTNLFNISLLTNQGGGEILRCFGKLNDARSSKHNKTEGIYSFEYAVHQRGPGKREVQMKSYEYEITKHPAGEFQRLVYFCTTEGECNYDQLPLDQMRILGDILSERGLKGWELVQLFFGNGGIVAFWKRAVES